MDKRSPVYYLKGFMFFYFTVSMLMMTYYPIYLKAKNMTGMQIGVIISFSQVATMLAQPFSGFLSDKYKTIKKILEICLIGTLIIGLILFHVNNSIELIAITFIMYIFMAPLSSLGDGIAQITSLEIRVSFGSIRLWGSAGAAIGSLICGWMLSKFGIEQISLLFGILMVITILFCLKMSDVKFSKKPVSFLSTFVLLKNKHFVWFLVIASFIGFAHSTNDTYIGVYLKDLGASETLVGWAWIIGISTEVIVFAFGHLWFNRFQHQAIIISISFLFGVRFFLMSITSDPLHLLLLQPLHGITFGIFYTIAFQYIAGLIPSHLQSLGYVLMGTTFFGVAGIIGSITGGIILDLPHGGSILYRCLSVVSFIAMISYIVYYKLIASSSRTMPTSD